MLRQSIALLTHAATALRTGTREVAMAPFTMRAGMVLIHGVAWFVSA
jgi:hypothetical protein